MAEPKGTPPSLVSTPFEVTSVAERGYTFTGFFQPVDNLPIINVANAGSAIPVKFSLGGNRGVNVFATGFPAISGAINCASTALESAVEEVVTAGSSSLSYDSTTGHYVYVWKTSAAWRNSCRQLILKLRDNTYHYANFRFKK